MRRTLTLLLAISLSVLGCGAETGDKTDAGLPDGGVEEDMQPEGFRGELDTFRDGSFVPLEESGEIEIISGFQGGWHVEPYLRLTGVESEELNGSARFWVEQSDTMIAESGQQLFEPIFFEDEGDSFVFFSQPVIFLGSNTPDNLTGTMATIRVDVQLEDGRSLDLSTDVTLINETEEFDF